MHAVGTKTVYVGELEISVAAAQGSGEAVALLRAAISLIEAARPGVTAPCRTAPERRRARDVLDEAQDGLAGLVEAIEEEDR